MSIILQSDRNDTEKNRSVALRNRHIIYEITVLYNTHILQLLSEAYFEARAQSSLPYPGKFEPVTVIRRYRAEFGEWLSRVRVPALLATRRRLSECRARAVTLRIIMDVSTYNISKNLVNLLRAPNRRGRTSLLH